MVLWSLCVGSTILYFCFLSFPRCFYHFRLVLFRSGTCLLRSSLSPREEGMSFWVCLISFCPFLGLWVHLAWLPAVLAHWAFTFFLRLSWPICLASTSYYICGHAGPLGFYLFLRALMTHLLCFYLWLHLWACWPIGLLPLSLGPHSPFALFYLFLWALMAPFLCFFLLSCLWACLLPFLAILAHWAFFLSFFFGPLWPICFYFSFSILLFFCFCLLLGLSAIGPSL